MWASFSSLLTSKMGTLTEGGYRSVKQVKAQEACRTVAGIE